MLNQLENEFHEAMLNIYRQAKSEASYDARRFIQMVETHGGIESARRLINAATVSEGYTTLWERQHLDLTVEAMIMRTEKYHSLFTEDELDVCAQRLKDYEYQI
ncbi:hypothetical protein [Candidatus Spongiihabitans sp.]|uniref:hypothetical protein n=1 Tax=Candidatus Spongiihabitans sp. TaxID=3101308 RepID=UPI003C7041C9